MTTDQSPRSERSSLLDDNVTTHLRGEELLKALDALQHAAVPPTSGYLAAKAGLRASR
jgi:hypothetical protein